jgi:hypothetical protein
MVDWRMSLEALKREAAALDEASRRELISFLISLREKQWTAQANAMARRLDDPDPSRWLTLEEFEGRLDRIAEPPAE